MVAMAEEENCSVMIEIRNDEVLRLAGSLGCYSRQE